MGLESLEFVFSGEDRWGDEVEPREVEVEADSMEDREAEDDEEYEGEAVDEEVPLLVALLGDDGGMGDIVEEEGVDGEEEEGVEVEEEVEEEATKEEEEEEYEVEDEGREGLEDIIGEDAVWARGDDDDVAVELVGAAVDGGAAVVIGEEGEEALVLLLRMEKLRKGDCFLDTGEVSIHKER